MDPSFPTLGQLLTAFQTAQKKNDLLDPLEIPANQKITVQLVCQKLQFFLSQQDCLDKEKMKELEVRIVNLFGDDMSLADMLALNTFKNIFGLYKSDAVKDILPLSEVTPVNLEEVMKINEAKLKIIRDVIENPAAKRLNELLTGYDQFEAKMLRIQSLLLLLLDEQRNLDTHRRHFDSDDDFEVYRNKFRRGDSVSQIRTLNQKTFIELNPGLYSKEELDEEEWFFSRQFLHLLVDLNTHLLMDEQDKWDGLTQLVTVNSKRQQVRLMPLMGEELKKKISSALSVMDKIRPSLKSPSSYIQKLAKTIYSNAELRYYGAIQRYFRILYEGNGAKEAIYRTDNNYPIPLLDLYSRVTPFSNFLAHQKEGEGDTISVIKLILNIWQENRGKQRALYLEAYNKLKELEGKVKYRAKVQKYMKDISTDKFFAEGDFPAISVPYMEQLMNDTKETVMEVKTSEAPVPVPTLSPPPAAAPKVKMNRAEKRRQKEAEEKSTPVPVVTTPEPAAPVPPVFPYLFRAERWSLYTVGEPLPADVFPEYAHLPLNLQIKQHLLHGFTQSLDRFVIEYGYKTERLNGDLVYAVPVDLVISGAPPKSYVAVYAFNKKGECYHRHLTELSRGNFVKYLIESNLANQLETTFMDQNFPPLQKAAERLQSNKKYRFSMTEVIDPVFQKATFPTRYEIPGRDPLLVDLIAYKISK